MISMAKSIGGAHCLSAILWGSPYFGEVPLYFYPWIRALYEFFVYIFVIGSHLSLGFRLLILT